MSNTQDIQRTILVLTTAIVDAINESTKNGGMGIPSGHLYAQLMSFGLTLNSYESILARLVEHELVLQDGSYLLTPGPKAVEFLARNRGN